MCISCEQALLIPKSCMKSLSNSAQYHLPKSLLSSFINGFTQSFSKPYCFNAIDLLSDRMFTQFSQTSNQIPEHGNTYRRRVPLGSSMTLYALHHLKINDRSFKEFFHSPVFDAYMYSNLCEYTVSVLNCLFHQ